MIVQPKCYKVKFYEQLVTAKDVDELIEKVKIHADSIPYDIFIEDEFIGKYKKYEGLRLPK
jgi:hypothetical protein